MHIETALVLLDADTYHLFLGKSPERLRNKLVRFYNGFAEDNDLEPVNDNATIAEVCKVMPFPVHLRTEPL
jgi:hypothetical protein